MLATYVSEIARAFGLEATGEGPRALRDLRARLGAVRPVASAKSIGEVLDALAECAREGGPPRRVRRQLAELDELVASGTFARTKRAERGRVFALLLLVFDLVHLTGASGNGDPATIARAVRRARR